MKMSLNHLSFLGMGKQLHNLKIKLNISIEKDKEQRNFIEYLNILNLIVL